MLRREPMADALAADALARPAVETVRRVALGLLARARAESARLDDLDDGAALHDFRVALRRLRSFLRAFRAELRGSVRAEDRRALRALQTATNAARDREVLAGWLERVDRTAPARERTGVRAAARLVACQLPSRTGRARRGVLRAFARVEARLAARLRRIVAELDPADPAPLATFAARFAAVLVQHGAAVREAWAAARGHDGAAHFHAARIALKRLRYLVEAGSPDGPARRRLLAKTRGLQTRLGELHDAFVWADLVAAARRARDPRARRRNPELDAGLALLARRARALVRAKARAVRGPRVEAAVQGLGPLLDELAAAATACLGPPVEIERKYLLRRLPAEVRRGTAHEIEQGWLPGKTLRERLRRTRVGAKIACTRTIKLGRGVTRIEVEEPASAELFEALWPLTAGARVRKRRHRVPHAGLVWEIDEFLDRRLVLAEVELLHRDQPVPMPRWLERLVVREVTDDPRYVNANLAR